MGAAARANGAEPAVLPGLACDIPPTKCRDKLTESASVPHLLNGEAHFAPESS
jgi:hypothetical protein